MKSPTLFRTIADSASVQKSRLSQNSSSSQNNPVSNSTMDKASHGVSLKEPSSENTDSILKSQLSSQNTNKSTINSSPADFSSKFYYQQDIETLISRSGANPDSSKTVDTIKRLSVMDFDNTLFCSPLPSSNIWDSKGIGMLKGDLGWFLEPKTLQSPYLSSISSRWVKQVELISRQEISRTDTLSVLLTGRSDYIYHEIIRSLLKSRGLHFDLVILKENTHIKWDPNDNIFTHRAKNDTADLENLVFAIKESNEFTFNYKMAVIDYILSKFLNINYVYMWDDRQNHCVKMQKYLDEHYVMTNRIKESIVYKKDQRTIYMDPLLEADLVNGMVDEFNHNIELNFEHSADTESVSDPKMGSQYLNTTLTQTLNAVSKKRKSHDVNLDKIRIEPLVAHSCVSFEPESLLAIKNIFTAPKFWCSPNIDMFLGKGILDPKTLAIRLGDYSAVYNNYSNPVISFQSGQLEYLDNEYPNNLVSYNDNVDIKLDGIGFISDKIYALRVSATTMYPGSRAQPHKHQHAHPIHKSFYPRGLKKIGKDITKYQNISKSEPLKQDYNTFIPIFFNEASGAHTHDSTRISKYISFDHINKVTIKELDSYFGTDFSNIVNIQLLREYLQPDKSNFNRNVLALQGKIEPSIRKTFVSDRMIQSQLEKKNVPFKSAVSVGSLIIDVWGDSIDKKNIGTVKQNVMDEMNKQSLDNSEINRNKILEIVKSLIIK
ncbi:hypothetical protein BB561_003310 [Smittium simulii]|uniref:Swiss Army Knife RNA repair protein HAD domain-containing protein n=1 Tax=Smittium simulii TaxID=133385 RepID=A0A2T9YM73_9FUNG|nr:hypothetical protein BB561_003310 [Smittium simulii]